MDGGDVLLDEVPDETLVAAIDGGEEEDEPETRSHVSKGLRGLGLTGRITLPNLHGQPLTPGELRRRRAVAPQIALLLDLFEPLMAPLLDEPVDCPRGHYHRGWAKEPWCGIGICRRCDLERVENATSRLRGGGASKPWGDGSWRTGDFAVCPCCLRAGKPISVSGQSRVNYLARVYGLTEPFPAAPTWKYYANQKGKRSCALA